MRNNKNVRSESKVYFNLLKELTISGFKLRYKGSILGVFWSVLKPAAMLLVSYIVFSTIFHVKTEHYVLFLFLGIILWNFFVESTTISMSNIMEKRSIIRAIYFPRNILVLSSVLNAFIMLLINICLLAILLIVYGITISFYVLFFIPILLLLFILSVGVAYLLSALYVKYRDIVHIWGVILQVGFWVTPIVYNITMVPQRYISAYMLNPLASIIVSSRDVIIYGSMPSPSIIVTVIMCIAIYFFGRYVYLRMSRYFAEEL